MITHRVNFKMFNPAQSGWQLGSVDVEDCETFEQAGLKARRAVQGHSCFEVREITNLLVNSTDSTEVKEVKEPTESKPSEPKKNVFGKLKIKNGKVVVENGTNG